MKRFLSVAAGVFLFVSQSQALFVNGGFEDGFTGWNISGDGAVVTGFTPQFNTNANWVNNAVTDAFYGDKMLMLGTPGIGNEWDNYGSGTLSPTAFQGTITQADMDNGAKLYFKWTALLEAPTHFGTHSRDEETYFSVKLSSGGSSLYYSDHRAYEEGFIDVGTNASGGAGIIWLSAGITEIDLAGLGFVAGDVLDLDLFVKDCGVGDHGGLVFLDGFGTTKPSESVPEPGLLVLLGMGLLGLAGTKARRR